MLYFIKSLNYLKIGYSLDRITYKKRINTYKTHNPDFKVLDVVEDGNKQDETYLHNKLEKYSYYTEWFYDIPQVYEVWEDYTKGMKRYDERKEKTKIILNKKQAFIINDKIKNISKEVHEVFGNSIILSGDEIKSLLSDIYFHYNAKFYPNIKTLEKFGYSLTRFLDGHTFKYKIKKLVD